MLRRALRRLYYAIGLDGTRLGAFILRVYKGRLHSIKRPNTDGVLVAFRITGGIGDHLIAARYIRDLIAAVGKFRFDVYSSRPEFAESIFGTTPEFNNAYNEYLLWEGRQFYRFYPLAMRIMSMVILQYATIKWQPLRQFPKLISICEHIDRFRKADHELNEIIRFHPSFDGLLASKAVFMNFNRHNLAHSMSGISYGGHAFPIPIDHFARCKFGLGDRPYVTIHNGFDAEFQTAYGFAEKSTKVYPHFDKVLALLCTRHPDLFVVQLGTKTSRPISGIGMNLIGETNLAEAAGILAGAALHIDNESGLVHLAACIGTVSCVLFGPTPAAYFGYENNINIAPRACGGCWWTTGNWMTDCPRGFERPICLAETPPDVVADAISIFLDERGNKVKAA